jgi:hypothetical protein
METATRPDHHVQAKTLRRRVLEVPREPRSPRFTPGVCRSCPICFRTPALAFSNHFDHVFHRTDLKWSSLQTGMIRYQADGFVRIPGLK